MGVKAGHGPNHQLTSARRALKSPSGSGRGMSRQDLADLANAYLFARFRERSTLDDTYIGRLERGDIRWPRARYREAIRHALGVDDDSSLGFFVVRKSEDPGGVPVPSHGSGTMSRLQYAPLARVANPGSLLEPLADAVAETLSLGGAVDLETIGVLKLAVDDLIIRYELCGPAMLAPEGSKLKGLLTSLTTSALPSGVAHELLRLRSQVTGLLGYMAVNLGRFAHAEAYCRQAFMLAQRIADKDLMAWICGTASFSAYYQQQYPRAVALAEDGLRYADGGPQSIRLMINGQARALAHIHGRRDEALQAVGAAYAIAERRDLADGISPCISLDVYSYGRLAANAVTVFQILGQTHKAIQLIGEVDSVVQTSDSNWSRALVRLDHAAALLQLPSADVEQAMSLAGSALDAATAAPITSVLQRAGQVLESAKHTRNGAVIELRDKIQSLREVSTIASASM